MCVCVRACVRMRVWAIVFKSCSVCPTASSGSLRLVLVVHFSSLCLLWSLAPRNRPWARGRWPVIHLSWSSLSRIFQLAELSPRPPIWFFWLLCIYSGGQASSAGKKKEGPIDSDWKNVLTLQTTINLCQTFTRYKRKKKEEEISTHFIYINLSVLFNKSGMAVWNKTVRKIFSVCPKALSTIHRL